MPAQTAPAARKAARKPATAKKAATASGAARTVKARPAAGKKAAAAPKAKTAAKTPRRSTKRPAAATRTQAPAVRRKTSRAPKPKAMEVLYSGRVFRSRLEARWAVFLDLLGVNWDYEPCHYEIGPDLYYLPDFYLPDQRTWLEVKGAPFMDAASYAKVLGAVAGPHRIPLREHPYTPSERLLLGGPFRDLKHGQVPLHTLITPAGGNQAHLSHAVFAAGPGGEATVTPDPTPWATVAATGVKAARRPAPGHLTALLEPAPRPGATPDPRIARAYDAAYRLTFDDTRRVADNAARTLLASLAHRRSGRPLGLTAAA